MPEEPQDIVSPDDSDNIANADSAVGDGVNSPSTDEQDSIVAPHIDQSDLDALITGEEQVEEAVTGASLDDVPLDGASADDVPLNNAELDDIIGAPEAPVEENEVPEDVDVPDLAAEAEMAAADPDVGLENVAAGAAPDDQNPLDQDLLDSLISDAHAAQGVAEEPVVMDNDDDIVVAEDESEIALGGEGWGEGGDAEELPPAAEVFDAPRSGTPFRLPSLTISFPGFSDSLPKIAVSLLFGIACGLGTFSWLILNQDRLDDASNMQASGAEIIQRAVASAEGLIDDGLYDRAAIELDDALSAAPGAPNRNEAVYLRIKSAYLRLSDAPEAREAEALLADMGAFAQDAADHPRVTEVLRWQGDVYGRTGIPLAALGVYNDLLTNYVAPLDGDRVLLEAGKSALALDRPQQAADYLLRLRQEYPASDYADEAGLYQGDAYRALGSREKAELVYRQIAVSNPANRIGGQAYARLAQISYDDGAYDDAIELLETRLATATTTDGNEEAYLLLARSLRATGQHDEAERVLRELTQFFPENPRTAEALVELSQVMEARGHRPEAANIARQAAQRFPTSSEALQNAAVFLAQAGDERAAAESLLEADAAGAEKPELLLEAARRFAESGETVEAQRTYEQLLEMYGDSAEAFDGRIELAGIYFDQGKVQKSIDWLEDLATVNADSPRAIPVLTALGERYRALGLQDRASESLKKVAAIAGEQPVLARAATALLEGDDVESGLAAAHQVDVDRLPDDLGYRFLRAHGLALRQIDGRRSLAQLERAHQNYPNERKPADTLDLLRSYLAADRTGAARAIVMDLNAQAKSDISAAPALTKAAVMWGDHLFERRDFRAAAEAYALAQTAVTEDGKPLTDWARLQQANAMLQLRDVGDSVALLEEVSQSGGVWSSDAALRQAYADVERRLAHEEPLRSIGD